ncbi:hypothetical protein CMQ_6862 [Grosmannia clavigera kw1407]|uniref:Uncharacterized protein n=1 Tax=Grosmannia clavigera (strain kw1407 / UAMH 11150) TaxID=655863 RepID=F0X775_GROCL|nr:uncharacterized protein CMQ_6862 [Grosmannia clavigera kw1407]EFX06541.1 hypothetical protein CMQ_6862 [Grosmannia clavigera kw1407]
MASALLCAAVWAVAVPVSVQAAVALQQARATVTAELAADGISPVPTPGPDLRALLRRQHSAATTVYFAEDNTCGFLTGREDNAYTCNDQLAQCAIITVSQLGLIGCCDGHDCGGFHLDCVDFDSYWSSDDGCDSSCQTDMLTLKCSDVDTPYCNTASINGGTTLQVYGYFCDAQDISTVQPIMTTYAGEADDRSFSPSVLSDVSSTDPSDDPSPSTSTTPHPSSSPSSSPAPATKSAKKSNVGAIAGGTVGGVAALALLGLAIALIMRSRRKDVQMQTQMMQPPPLQPQMQQQLPPQPPPPGPSPSMQKMPEYAVTPQQPQYPGSPGLPAYSQPNYAQPIYTAAGQVPPVRTGSASPLSPDYNRMSSISGMSTGTSAVGPISPQTTGHTMATVVPNGGAGAGAGVPPTIHEAGGDTVGATSDNHHGQMHELA